MILRLSGLLLIIGVGLIATSVLKSGVGLVGILLLAVGYLVARIDATRPEA